MRERLARYYQQTVRLTAYFNKYGRTTDGSNVALLVNVRLDSQLIMDHAWVHRSKHMKRLDLKAGDLVMFEAQVGRYARTGSFVHVSEIEYDYCLDRIRDFQIVRRRSERTTHEQSL